MTEIERCPTCGSIVSRREIALYRGLIVALYRVYEYVSLRGEGYRFTRKEIKHLLKSENDSARFGDLIFFGGLVFKEGKAHYGLNMERCREFFRNNLAIPTKIWKDPITNELEKTDYRKLRQIPSILEKLDAEGFYIANYEGGD
jgi:hypothetical protein